MTLTQFRTVLRYFNQYSEVSSVVQRLTPALCQTGQHTCRTRSALISQHSSHGLHTLPSKLIPAHSCMLQQKRGVRKLFPEPFEQDPELNSLPDEYTHLDLNYVPHLGGKGKDIVENIREADKQADIGRLFAVVHIDGKQRKITTEDLVLINGFFPPQIGDKIRLEKVMMVGGKDFTLIGKPLLKRDMVNIEATVIEKTLSHVRVHFTMLKRFRRLKLLQHPQTVIVINKIEVEPTAL
ncbi:39S ribosomal protein L21, mitochondrial-like [Mya arenaria]|uniref:39S ribosomal protein L21, mitochondrial-like n=1 Tax=Mya arenaria TaxID=6604 RepID=UPI0022E7F754|nr:39S ribosomal protein L21, mitochondrial-like [Mya arenaria]